MITDRIQNYNFYLKVHEGFPKAFEFVQEFLKNPMAEGRYTIDGDKIYANVSSYETQHAKNKKFETHNQYIDLQYVVSGCELIYLSEINHLRACIEYDSEKDFTLYTGDDETAIRMDADSFCILFPWEAHKPGCICNNPDKMRKIVVKILV